MDSKNESRIEYKSKESKNDNLKQNSEKSQFNVVKDTNKESSKGLNEELNKEVNKEINKLFYKESTNKKQNKEDEIPLIDDGVEETTEKNENHLQTSSANSSINNKLNQTRSNCDEMHELKDYNYDEKVKTIASQIVHHLSTDQNLKQDSQTQNSASDTRSEKNLTAGGLDQMMNNFQSVRLNEDESIESVSSGNAHDINDLCQLDLVELNPDEQEEKERLIQQLLELRNTLDDLSTRVNSVREMSFKLANENNVLNQYVENLISASSVFQSLDTSPTSIKRKQRK